MTIETQGIRAVLLAQIKLIDTIPAHIRRFDYWSGARASYVQLLNFIDNLDGKKSNLPVEPIKTPEHLLVMASLFDGLGDENEKDQSKSN